MNYDLDDIIEMMESGDTFATCNNPDCGYEQEVEPDGGGHTCHECGKGKMINPIMSMGFI